VRCATRLARGPPRPPSFHSLSEVQSPHSPSDFFALALLVANMPYLGEEEDQLDDQLNGQFNVVQSDLFVDR
jgi:hypothetical protein